MKVGVGGTTAIYARRTVVIEAGQTQSVDLVRTSGFAIHGEVTGLKDTDAPGAYIYVRSAEATGNPGVLTDWNLPLFDAMTCDQDGVFRTARLEPGTYTISAEAYKPETPEEARRSGWRLPSYVGKVKLTVTAGVAPAPVRIEMRPRE
jgi:hypothetical protein